MSYESALRAALGEPKNSRYTFVPANHPIIQALGLTEPEDVSWYIDKNGNYTVQNELIEQCIRKLVEVS